ncbi:MAG TPA: hypothetical protein VLB80_04410 [Candidatus Babeliales bacterium]|nr:hypothetical protein [Candidatus Babeliales bacterium]
MTTYTKIISHIFAATSIMLNVIIIGIETDQKYCEQPLIRSTTSFELDNHLNIFYANENIRANISRWFQLLSEEELITSDIFFNVTVFTKIHPFSQKDAKELAHEECKNIKGLDNPKQFRETFLRLEKFYTSEKTNKTTASLPLKFGLTTFNSNTNTTITRAYNNIYTNKPEIQILNFKFIKDPRFPQLLKTALLNFNNAPSIVLSSSDDLIPQEFITKEILTRTGNHGINGFTAKHNKCKQNSITATLNDSNQ